MSAYFRANIAAMAGYTPGEQPQDDGIIKLNTNENPYPPSPKVYAALRKAINPSLAALPRATERYPAIRRRECLRRETSEYFRRQWFG